MSQAELMDALASAQAEFGVIKKSKTAVVKGKTKDGKPYEYGFEYADLADVLHAVRPILGKHGVALLQDFTEDGKAVVTTLAKGEAERTLGRYPIMCRNPEDPMKYAGAVTFAKRYSLNMALGLHADTLDADDLQGVEGRDKEWDPGALTAKTPIESIVITRENANSWANRWIKEAAEAKSAHELDTLLDVTAKQRDELEMILPDAVEAFRKTESSVRARFSNGAAA